MHKHLVTIIITAIALSWTSPSFAQEVNRNRCWTETDRNSNSNCDRLQARQPRSKKAEKSEQKDGLGGYAGLTLGAFFPDLDESRGIFRGNNTELDDVAVGSSIFAGIKFNRYLATEIEFSGFVGDADSDLDEDENYTLGAIFLSPRFALPLGDQLGDRRNSLALFLSPGLGVSQLTSNVADEIDDFDRTTVIEDDTRFTWQIKGGVLVPVSKKFSVLGQVRYASQTGDDAIDYLGTEVGVNFDF